MSFQNSDYRGISDEERIGLENQRKQLEILYATDIKQKIEELEKNAEKDPKNADELKNIIADVKKSPFFSCQQKDLDRNKTDIEQVKICLGYFINPGSKSVYSGLSTSEVVANRLDSLYKSVMKHFYRPSTPDQVGKGGKRSRKYKRKSIKKLRKKSRHNIKNK
jgi:hypothetical protein